MGFIARQYDTSITFTDTQALEALERVVPAELIRAAAVAAAVPTQRRRKLPSDVTLLLCIGMSLFTAQALDVVLATMTRGLRLFWPDQEPALATKGAISQARYRLGARPLVALFHQVCRPLATPQTPGAFRYGLRLLALAGPLVYRAVKRPGGAVRVASVSGLAVGQPSLRARCARWLPVARVAAFGLLVVALARPQAAGRDGVFRDYGRHPDLAGRAARPSQLHRADRYGASRPGGQRDDACHTSE